MPSDDTPNDDQLERDPSYGIDRSGPVGRHGPKLAKEPDPERTINLAEMREELASMRGGYSRDDDEPEPPPRQQPRRQQQRNGWGSPPMQAREPVRARLGVFREAAPRPHPVDAEVWDKAFDAALPLVIGLVDSAQAAVELAAQFADLKLEERRRRFG